jgi:alpha-ketoglutaric semialdehyde dehydrogenase
MLLQQEVPNMLCQNYVGGRWQDARGGKTFASINPANGETVAEVALSTTEDVGAAVEAAAAAFEGWRKTPAPKRGEILFRAGEILVQRKEELARLMTQEMGKVLRETRGDVQEAIDMVYYMAGEGRRLFGHTTPSELPNKFVMTLRDPVGVVAAVTPWNFPIAIPSWKVAPALIAGNTVVLKPASDTPLLAWHLVKILEEAGLPPGVLNLVMGPGGEVGRALVEHPQVTLISFTGSTPVGTQMAQQATANGKRVSLEMGGKNGIIVMDDADLNLAVEGITWSAFGTTGQRCTAASRIIAHRAIAAELTEMMVEQAKALSLGDGLLPGVEVGPIVNESQRKRVHSYVEIGQQEGARLRTGGKMAEEGELGRGFFYLPTIFDEVKPDMRIAQEETFGPVTAVISVNSLEEAIAVNNSTGFGLSSSIYTREVNRAFAAIRDISTGLIYVNSGTIGAEVHVPFGGTRGTGNGHRDAGQAALEVFSEWKTVFVDFSGKLQRAQIDIEPNTP